MNLIFCMVGFHISENGKSIAVRYVSCSKMDANPNLIVWVISFFPLVNL